MNIYSGLFSFYVRLTILLLIPFRCVTLTHLEKEVRILSADQKNTLILFKRCKVHQGIERYANRKEMRSRAANLKVDIVQILNTTSKSSGIAVPPSGTYFITYFEEVRFWKCPIKILSEEFILAE